MEHKICTFGAATVAEYVVPDGVFVFPNEGDLDAIRLCFISQGAAQYVEEDGRGGMETRLISRGQAFFTVGTRQVEFTGVDGCVLLEIAVPLTAPVGGGELPTFYVMRGALPLAQPVFAFASNLFALNLDAFEDVSRRQSEALLIAMVRAVTPQPYGELDSPLSDPYARACAIILARAAEADLRADSIAREVSISLRHLERAFRERGTTLAAEIRCARVQRAIAILQSDVSRRYTMDQVGRAVGLSGGSSLARAFRAEGRGSPQHWRPRGILA